MTEKESVLPGLTGQIIALELGDPDGIPIIALHGWLDNAASFIPLCEHLEKFRWLCLDLPGHGKSAHRPAGGVYHLTDYVADLHAVVQELDLQKCNLVGHSLGAGVVAMFAAAFPGKVNRLVLLDGLGPIAGEDVDSLIQLRESMAFFEQISPDNSLGYTTWEALKNARLRSGIIAPHSVELLLRRGAKWVDDRFVVLSDARLKQPSSLYMSQEKILAILGGIEASTLLVMAKNGLLIKSMSTAKRIAAIQNLTTVTVEGAHHVHMDNPELVAQEIERFMALEHP